MKRYMLFAGMFYYPNGGMDDCVGIFDSIEEAKDYVNKMISGDESLPEEHQIIVEWWSIYDTVTGISRKY